MSKIYWISGIDTDIGKTVATGMMARYLARRGVRAITAKLVQTGNDGFSEDLERHRVLAGTGRFPEDDAHLTSPQIFHFPASPHLAAELEHKTVDLNQISESIRELGRRYDNVLVEGAGGLAVPLTEDLLTIDFAAAQGWTPILVTSTRLGSLNHTIMSFEMFARRNLRPAGVVCNCAADEDAVIARDTQRMIRKYLAKFSWDEHALVRMPRIDFANPPDIDFSAIFTGDGK